MPDSGFPHAADPRRGRFSEPGRPYLVTTVTRGRKPVFRHFGAGRLLVDEMRLSERDSLVESLAGVIVPDCPRRLLVLRSGSLATLLKGARLAAPRPSPGSSA
ncbi:hypothetical protein [Azorhizophilus paspali]|uniref:Transposase n=1 Tax=Azorhizophilus paspali TaxID=69963 RepID=A0ABV6SQ64_AZOPA